MLILSSLGERPSRDHEEALKWFTTSAKQIKEFAQFKFGIRKSRMKAI